MVSLWIAQVYEPDMKRLPGLGPDWKGPDMERKKLIALAAAFAAPALTCRSWPGLTR
jgi:hypothetical protein